MEQYRKSPRANFINYDYGVFFVTICTKNMKHYFGEIVDAEMRYSEIGAFVDDQLNRCSEFRSDVEMLVHTVMPNHIHCLVYVDAPEIPDSIALRVPNPALRPHPDTRRHVTALSKYVNSLKGTVTKYAKSKGLKMRWHGRYHEHKIRGERDGRNITEYILNNQANWESDCFH